MAFTRFEDGASDKTNQIYRAERIEKSNKTSSAEKILALGSPAFSTAVVQGDPDQCALGT
jgi:hypothetical protein